MAPPLKYPALFSLVLILGFAAAVLLRVLVGGNNAAFSVPAALVFAGCLMLFTFASKTKLKFNNKVIFIGLAGGLFLCLPAVILKITGSSVNYSYGGFANWAVVAVVVALAEEAFLRGALYDAVNKWRGEKAAIVIAALLFAALHIPLYGWRVVPLDFAVGLWLGALRSISGTFVAPAIAHSIADLASWWI